MRVKTISVKYERAFNLGDYNSLRIEASAWADLEDGENERVCYEALFSEVKEVVKEQAMPVLKQIKAKVQEVFSGLPIVNEGK